MLIFFLFYFPTFLTLRVCFKIARSSMLGQMFKLAMHLKILRPVGAQGRRRLRLVVRFLLEEMKYLLKNQNQLHAVSRT